MPAPRFLEELKRRKVVRVGVVHLAVVWAALLTSACDGDESGAAGPESATATVEFVYLASTTIDPAVQSMFPECAAGVGSTHIHPGWRAFERVNMQAVASDRWMITFTDVPVGGLQRIRISDPNVCARNPTGAATEGVRANGTELTRIVDTPGSGIEPGLGFVVAADGSVSP